MRVAEVPSNQVPLLYPNAAPKEIHQRVSLAARICFCNLAIKLRILGFGLMLCSFVAFPLIGHFCFDRQDKCHVGVGVVLAILAGFAFLGGCLVAVLTFPRNTVLQAPKRSSDFEMGHFSNLIPSPPESLRSSIDE